MADNNSGNPLNPQDVARAAALANDTMTLLRAEINNTHAAAQELATALGRPMMSRGDFERDLNRLIALKTAMGEITSEVQAEEAVMVERERTLREYVDAATTGNLQTAQAIREQEQAITDLNTELYATGTTAAREAEILRSLGPAYTRLTRLEAERARLAAITPEMLRNAGRELKNLEMDKVTKSLAQSQASLITGFLGIQSEVGEAGKLIDNLLYSFRNLNDLGEDIQTLDPFDLMVKGAKKFADSLNNILTTGNVVMAFVHKVFQSTVALVKSTDEAFTSFTKTTGLTDQTYKDLIVTTYESNYILGKTIQEYGEIVSTLETGLSDFYAMDEAGKKQLIETAAVYENLGVSSSEYDEALTNITKSGGMSAEALNGMTKTAINMGLGTKWAISTLNQHAEHFFQYSGPKMAEEMARMGAISKNLGIEVGTIIGAMKQFDTFEGAANSVGRLNAMLRGPYFNTLEMLRATETERVELLQRGLHESGLSWDTANRYQKKYIAEQAGLSVVDMGKIVRGEDTYEGLAGKQASFNESLNSLKGLASAATPFIKQFTVIMQHLAIALEPIIGLIRGLAAGLAETPSILYGVAAALLVVSLAGGPVKAVFMAISGALALLFSWLHKPGSPPLFRLPAAMGENMTILGDAASGVARLLNATVVPVFSAIYDVFHWVWEKLSKLSAFDWIGLGGAVVGLGTAFHILRAAVVGFPLGFLGALRLSFSTLGGVLKLPYTMVTSLGAALGTLAMKIPFVSSAMTAFAARRAAETPVVAASGAAMSVWAKNIFAVGIGIGAAAAGLAYFASVMKTLEATDFGAIVFGLAIFGAAIFRLLAFVATLSVTAVPALLPIAGIILALGAAFALAGLGIWAMGQGMVLLAEAGVEALAPLAALTAFILTTASSGLGLLLSAAALVGIAIGLGLIAAALAITDEDALSSLARMMDGLSKIGSEHASLVAGLAYMAGALEEVDEDEIDALTKLFAKLDGLQINITGLDSVVSLATSGISYELFMIAQALGAIAGAGFFLNFGAVGAIEDITEALQEVPTEKAVALASVLEHTAIAASAQVDTGALAKDMEKIASVSSNVALSLIDARKKEKKQEGVLITDKLVVNLGGGKTFEKRVVDIVNKKISPRRT